MAEELFRDDLPADDPGNILWKLMQECEWPDLEGDDLVGRCVDDVCYTATERGLVDFKITPEFAVTIWKLIELARQMDEASRQKIRM